MKDNLNNVLRKEKKEDCRKCKFYKIDKNKCDDKQVFVSKKNRKEIVCRYNENSILFEKVYK